MGGGNESLHQVEVTLGTFHNGYLHLHIHLGLYQRHWTFFQRLLVKRGGTVTNGRGEAAAIYKKASQPF